MRRSIALFSAILLGSSLLVGGTAAASDGTTCHPTGTGLTAKVVNEDVVGDTIDVEDCDVGAFFDEAGTVSNATFVQPDDDPAPNVQYLVRVEGAQVDVSNSTFDVTDDYQHQIVDIGYLDGASGTIANNTLTGFKRAGILLDGTGTSGTVRDNELTGVGPKDTGWAENGIQVSRGAGGVVRDNDVTDHWWDKRDFCSSGVIVFGADNVTVGHNTVKASDCGIILAGDGNESVRNHIVVHHRNADTVGFLGVGVFGDENDVLKNNIRSHPTHSADTGIFVQGDGNVVQRNIVNGFEEGVVVVGDGEESNNVATPAGSQAP